MALPEGLSEWEFLQDLLRRYQNREIRDWFADLGGDDWNPDITVPRGAIRHACTHKDNDTADMTLIRMFLFSELVRGRLQSFFSESNGDTGETTLSYDKLREGKPQIVLWFIEDIQDTEPGYSPVKGRISFRVPNETLTSITTAKLTTIATKIRQEFAIGQGYVWRKGRLMVSYTDWEKGYQLQVLAIDRAEGRRVINSVLDIQNDIIDDSKLRYNETDDETGAYPVIPPTEIILGDATRLPRRRPRADVRFAFAEAILGKGVRPVILVDRIGVKPNPLVSV